MAHIEKTYARAYRDVFGDEPTPGSGVFNRHVPSTKVDHLRLQSAMRSIQCSFLERGYSRCSGGGHGNILSRTTKPTLTTIGTRPARVKPLGPRLKMRIHGIEGN